MEEKIECVQVGQLKAVHARNHALEVAGHPRSGDLFPENRIVLRLQRDQADVGSVSLVARACVREIAELDQPYRPSGGRMVRLTRRFLLDSRRHASRLRYSVRLSACPPVRLSAC